MEAQRLDQPPASCFLELGDYLESSGLMSSSTRKPFPAPAAYCFSLKCVPESRIISWKVTFPHLHWDRCPVWPSQPPCPGGGKQKCSCSSWTSGNGHSVQLLPLAVCFRSSDTHLFDKVRGYDIKLLRYLSVKYICDLMVENKKVKFGMK